jgi:F-type H+-transporting ATPase subunit delta
MRGVSAETREAVLAVVDRQVSDGADAAELGDDLFAVVGVLDAQPALRRMLTNPSSSSDAKNGLVARLFDGKIGAPAFEALGAAASGRWNGTRDFADALEDAGVEAHLAGAERSGDLESAEDELFRFSRVVHGNPALRAALSDRTMSVARKRELVGALLEKRALSATVSLVKQAVAARRRAFELTLEDYVEVAAARRNHSSPPCAPRTTSTWTSANVSRMPSRASTASRCTSTSWSSRPCSGVRPSRSVAKSSTPRSPDGSSRRAARWRADPIFSTGTTD